MRVPPLSVLPALALAAVCVPAAPAAVLEVPSKFPTINAALDSATAGDVVLVAPGRYTPTDPRGSVQFALLKDGVALVSEAGPHLTILDMSAVSGASIVAVSGSRFVTAQTQVEGFTFIGSASRPSQGVYIDGGGNVTVQSCIFRDFLSGYFRSGSALRVFSDFTVVVDCEFYGCISTGSRAVLQTSSSVLIGNCRFESCANAVKIGGGSSALPRGSITVSTCTFENITGRWALSIHGGILEYVQVVQSTFLNCRADGPSGTVLSMGPLADFTVVRDNLFVRCSGAGIGAAYIGACPLDVAGNTFQECSVFGASPYRSVIRVNGCFVQSRFSHNVFANCSGGPAVDAGPVTTEVPSNCNVFWNNPDGHTVGFELSATDRVVDPGYCDPDADQLSLAADSPLLPANSGGCGLIGAVGQGCGPVSLESRSWGSIKSLYR